MFADCDPIAGPAAAAWQEQPLMPAATVKADRASTRTTSGREDRGRRIPFAAGSLIWRMDSRRTRAGWEERHDDTAGNRRSAGRGRSGRSDRAAPRPVADELLRRCEQAATPAARSDACATLEAARRAFRVKFLASSGRTREAEADADAGLAARPGLVGTAMLLAARAQPWADAGRFAEARRDLDEALRVSGMPLINRVSALSLRAAVRTSLGDERGAEADYDAAIAADPTNGEALVARGSFRDEHRRYGEALADYSAATRTNPDWVVGFNQVCFLLAARMRRDYDRAQVACDRAVALAPDNAAIQDSAGLLAMRRGRWADASGNYDRAVGLAPDDASFLYGRGITRLRTGRQAEGRADIAAAVRRDPGAARTWVELGITP